jgi:hypothetical protein
MSSSSSVFLQHKTEEQVRGDLLLSTTLVVWASIFPGQEREESDMFEHPEMSTQCSELPLPNSVATRTAVSLALSELAWAPWRGSMASSFAPSFLSMIFFLSILWIDANHVVTNNLA